MGNIDAINKGPNAAQLIRLAYDNQWSLEAAYFEMERHYDAFYHIACMAEQRKALVAELRDLGLVEGKCLIDADIPQLMGDLNLHGET